MAVPSCTCLYITVLWIYFTVLNSTLLYYWSTSFCLTLHYFTMVLLHSTWFYVTLARLYFTLPWLYFTLLDSTLLYYSSTSLYLTLHHTLMALVPSTVLLIGSTSLQVILPGFCMTHSTFLHHLIPQYSTMALIYVPLLYYGSTSFCLTLHYSTMALLHCIWFYITIAVVHCT